MKFTTPAFWSSRSSVVSLALIPVSWLYRFGHLLHQRRARPYASRVPVLCVGNLTAGGSGKTPTALALARLVRTHGIARHPVFLTRGYGGTVAGDEVAMVDPATDAAARVGDEALLLAHVAPTIVAPDRAAGARRAEQTGADLIILDDGMQNTRLARTFDLLVVDGGAGFGNGRLLPAGPLRTPLRRGLQHVKAVLCIGGPCPQDIDAAIPRFAARLETPWRPEAGRTYYAFCGLGRPEKFFTMLETLGVMLAGRRAFPDHHAYTADDLRTLAKAGRDGWLLTTAKDAVRITPEDRARLGIETVPVELVIDDEAALADLLRRGLGGRA